MKAVLDIKSLPIAAGSDIRQCDGQKSTLNERLSTTPSVALLTAGRDKPYALGLAGALISAGITFDYIGSDMVDGPELYNNPYCRVLKLRDQRLGASWKQKVRRVLRYYLRLICYATSTEARIFHILWNNKFELFDRTALMVYYKLLAKRIVLTAHNVNAGARDLKDSRFNRMSLKVQYKLSDLIFVHTEAMKRELIADYSVDEEKVVVIPFGINNTVPLTDLSPVEAKQRLGVSSSDKAVLFFGNIAAYKGLEYLVDAFVELAKSDKTYRLIIVGKPKGQDHCWTSIKKAIEQAGIGGQTIQVIDYVPDEATEVYFKAADVLVLPYTRVFQSGVLFLSYSFGLPVIAADIASLKDEIDDGETGFVFKPCDSVDLAEKIGEYFESDLFRNLEARRLAIKEYANERYSWEKVATITTEVYAQLLAH